ncbi:hypothetical protein ACHAPX_006808 [Trichoderma viride]
MVENPGGELWVNEEVKTKIRARLWRSWTVFEQTLKDIQVAINDISDKIGIGSDVQWSDASLVAKELKRAGFTLRRSAYEGLLATVKDGISTLESLARIDIELEPSRRTIESLQVPEEILGDDLYPLSLYMTARRLLGEVAQASSNYGSAVSRCIDGEFQEKNLENEDDRHDIYCGVIALLEEDLNNS